MKKKGEIILIVILSLCILGVGALIVRNMSKQRGKNPAQDTGASESVSSTENGNSVSDQSSKDNESTIEQQNHEGESMANTSTYEGKQGSSILNTGNLTEAGQGYEGKKGTGDFNYGEALQKSLLFYELQRSGDLPEEVRCNWRGDSALMDGSDAGLDLTGGLYDAGDNVKFNLPMAYTASMLAWSVYESRDAYEEAGQLTYALGDIKWITDYLIKCHPEKEVYYYQVGDGNQDHGWWGPAECVEQRMSRPSYKVTKDQPGSTVVASAAAALASCAVVFEKEDKEYADLCLSHAMSLFAFADSTRSDAGYTASNGFYTSNSGFMDELSWAAVWLYLASGEKDYLTKAEETYKQANSDYVWAQCWDDVHYGAGLLLARITKDQKYKDATELHLDYWTTGTASGERITYSPKGLAWLDSWGSLRYATTTAFLAAVYSKWDGCDSKKAKTYWDFAVAQTNYALGSTGQSYVVGFGENAPEHPHHRTAQGSYADNMNEPSEHRHTLYGALVGGPDANDQYEDTVTDYCKNEVACDYNAGFTGALAMLYSEYHGQTLKDFGAVEPVTEDEFFVEAGVNVDGKDFVEVKAYIINRSAWPARAAKNVEMRYYVDLSEVYADGRTAADIDISTNYMQAGTVGELTCYDQDKHIFYLPVMFDDGSLYPGGQSQYKKEVQIRLTNKEGAWDNLNDPSYNGIGSSGNVAKAYGIALFENGNLIFGSEPGTGAGNNAGKTVSSLGESAQTSDKNEDGTKQETEKTTEKGTGNAGPSSAKGDKLSVSVKYDSTSNSISGTMEIQNIGDSALDLSKLKVCYYLSKDSASSLVFDCYYAAVNVENGAGSSLSKVNGAYRESSRNSAGTSDTMLEISFGDDVQVIRNAVLMINFSIHDASWGDLTTSNDFSMQDAGNIVFIYDGNVIGGNEPQ